MMTDPDPPPAAQTSPDPPTPAPAGKPSGLRNPGAAVRGVGAATLALEGLMLLLAIVPLKVLRVGGGGVWVVVVLAVLSFVLAGMLGRRWGWIAGSVLQILVLASGFVVHLSLTALGVIFGGVWLYVLFVRRSVLSGSPGDATR